MSTTFVNSLKGFAFQADLVLRRNPKNAIQLLVNGWHLPSELPGPVKRTKYVGTENVCWKWHDFRYISFELKDKHVIFFAVRNNAALITLVPSSFVPCYKCIKLSCWSAVSFMSPLRLPYAKSSTNSRVQRWRFTKKAGSIPGQACIQFSSIIHPHCSPSLVSCIFNTLLVLFLKIFFFLDVMKKLE